MYIRYPQPKFVSWTQSILPEGRQTLDFRPLFVCRTEVEERRSYTSGRRKGGVEVPLEILRLSH